MTTPDQFIDDSLLLAAYLLVWLLPLIALAALAEWRMTRRSKRNR